MAPGNYALPANLTQQHVQEVLQVSTSSFAHAIRARHTILPRPLLHDVAAFSRVAYVVQRD